MGDDWRKNYSENRESFAKELRVALHRSADKLQKFAGLLRDQKSEGRRSSSFATCASIASTVIRHPALSRLSNVTPTRDARFAATIELRGMMDVTPAFAEQDANGLYRYLVDIGIVSDDLPAISPADPIIGDVDAAHLIPTPVPGALLYDVEIGEWVEEGQRLVTVLSEAGTEGYEMRSPFDGQVMTRRDVRFARRGDDVIKVLSHPLP